MDKQYLFNRLSSEKLIGIIRAEDRETALLAATAAIEAGMKILELTFTTPDCDRLISELKSKFPDHLIGAGSIRQIVEVEKALDCGADFFVSPHLDQSLLQSFADEAYIPGVMTPTEIMKASEWGASFLKLFPGDVYGPSGFKSLTGPFPLQNFMITGGVDLSNAKAYLEAGAAAIGVGGALFSKKILADRNWRDLETEIEKWLKIIA